MCQRPKRAFLISTLSALAFWRTFLVCVNALNGLFLFLPDEVELILEYDGMCQRPKRAFLISTMSCLKLLSKMKGVNALNGLFLFLRYPLKPRINTGFPASFLQVFIWIFWNRGVSGHFLACSQFVHIFTLYHLLFTWILYLILIKN